MRQEKPSEIARKEAIARWKRQQEEDRDPEAVKSRLRKMFDDVYRGAAFFAAVAVGWVLWDRIDMAWWAAVPVAIGAGVVLWRFRSKRVLYAGSVAVFLLAIVCTVGVISSSPDTVPSVVVGKWTKEGGGYYTSTGQSVPKTTVYKVRVACQDSETGHLVASLDKPSWDALHIGEQIDLIYYAESILGVWHIGLVVDSINSERVVFGGSSGFHGGGWAIFGSVLSLILGIFPPSLLIFKEYLE